MTNKEGNIWTVRTTITGAEIIIASYVKTVLMKRSTITIAPITTVQIMTNVIFIKDTLN